MRGVSTSLANQLAGPSCRVEATHNRSAFSNGAFRVQVMRKYLLLPLSGHWEISGSPKTARGLRPCWHSVRFLNGFT